MINFTRIVDARVVLTCFDGGILKFNACELKCISIPMQICQQNITEVIIEDVYGEDTYQVIETMEEIKKLAGWSEN